MPQIIEGVRKDFLQMEQVETVVFTIVSTKSIMTWSEQPLTELFCCRLEELMAAFREQIRNE